MTSDTSTPEPSEPVVDPTDVADGAAASAAAPTEASAPDSPGAVTTEDAPVAPVDTDPAPAAADPAPAAADSAPADADPASVDPRPVPVPRPTPRPRPAAPRPPSATTPTSTSAPAPAAEPWGRVDDDGTVSVREESGWRVVGQYPDGTPAEALAYFERKFADLAAEVRLLESRGERASSSDLKHTADALRVRIVDAAAVGDLASLGARLDALDGSLAERSEAEAAAQREAVDAAIAERTGLVEKAEALAAKDPATIQWKQTTADIGALFDEWQRQQHDGPRLPKALSQQLWKRFRDARGTLDRARREFFADLDSTHRTARDAKTRLIEQAQALAARGEDGISSYRDLLEKWKASGRAGKKADDALWAQFKAAGDALYAARSDREAAETEESRGRIETREALLEEAQAVAKERDIAKARSLLTGIQRRWDDVGRIFPRDAERALDDRLRKVESALRGREDADWKANDPTQKARANDMTRQLTDAIDKLEAAAAAAKKSGNAKAEKEAHEALEARRAWLRALGG